MRDHPSPIDLHSHSTASDGSLAPAALVAAAAAAGITTLALTDHDTTAGIDTAADAARALGIRLIPGVEISVTWERRTVHVVGLGIDPGAPTLRKGLATLQDHRLRRAETIATGLSRVGLDDALARVGALAGDGQITRSHFAALLVESGLCPDARRAFKRFLAPGKVGHVPSQWVELETAIAWIRDAGGHAVLAHPLKYPLSRSARQRLLRQFRDAGGTGLEVSSGRPQRSEIETAAADALAFSLYGSAGSDFHGDSQPWNTLGHLPPLPDHVPSLIDLHPDFA
ncbi:MAG: PHP domain-containing protein [Nevskiales bacterium]|nr:PHP domain-containing protein [Nevskiales bacterium]